MIVFHVTALLRRLLLHSIYIALNLPYLYDDLLSWSRFVENVTCVYTTAAAAAASVVPKSEIP